MTAYPRACCIFIRAGHEQRNEAHAWDELLKEKTPKPVGGNVDFADHVKQKRFFDARVLREEEEEKRRGGETTQWQKEFHIFFTASYRVQDVEEIFKSGKLRNQLLHHLAKGLEDGVVVDTRQVEAAREGKRG